jgi:DNA-binding Lrp family transcriptional regulator
LRRVTAAIEENNVYSVDELAARLHLSRRCVCRRIRRILRRRILREYFFDGNLIHPTYRLGEKKDTTEE